MSSVWSPYKHCRKYIWIPKLTLRAYSLENIFNGRRHIFNFRIMLDKLLKPCTAKHTCVDAPAHTHSVPTCNAAKVVGLDQKSLDVGRKRLRRTQVQTPVRHLCSNSTNALPSQQTLNIIRGKLKAAESLPPTARSTQYRFPTNQLDQESMPQSRGVYSYNTNVPTIAGRTTGIPVKRTPTNSTNATYPVRSATRSTAFDTGLTGSTHNSPVLDADVCGSSVCGRLSPVESKASCISLLKEIHSSNVSTHSAKTSSSGTKYYTPRTAVLESPQGSERPPIPKPVLTRNVSSASLFSSRSTMLLPRLSIETCLNECVHHDTRHQDPLASQCELQTIYEMESLPTTENRICINTHDIKLKRYRPRHTVRVANTSTQKGLKVLNEQSDIPFDQVMKWWEDTARHPFQGVDYTPSFSTRLQYLYTYVVLIMGVCFVLLVYYITFPIPTFPIPYIVWR